MGHNEMLGIGVGLPALYVGDKDGGEVGLPEGVFVGCGVGEFLV